MPTSTIRTSDTSSLIKKNHDNHKYNACYLIGMMVVINITGFNVGYGLGYLNTVEACLNI